MLTACMPVSTFPGTPPTEPQNHHMQQAARVPRSLPARLVSSASEQAEEEEEASEETVSCQCWLSKPKNSWRHQAGQLERVGLECAQSHRDTVAEIVF